MMTAHAGGTPRIARLVCIASVIAVALLWTNSRIFLMRRNQPGGRPVVLAGYYYYHAMAVALERGRIGQFDAVRLTRYFAKNDPLAPYTASAPGSPPQWRNYYALDVGYLFVVEAARLAFPALPDSVVRALAFQLAADAVLLGFVIWLFAHWRWWLGILAGMLYSVNAAFCALATLPYYYYWDVPLTFIVIGAVLRSYRDEACARRWWIGAAVALGIGVWLRGSWWPLSAFVFALAIATPAFRRAIIVPLCVFGALAVPQVVRSSVARGTLALSTRAVWHVAMVGLGYLPNRYGLEPRDESVFQMTHERYGVEYREDDYFAHDQAAKQLFLEFLRDDPRFVLKSFSRRLTDSVLGSARTGVLSYWRVNNLAYRLLALAGLIAMFAVGGELRVLAGAVAGIYVIYVILTCAFFFVAPLYDNVPETTLLVCVIGGIESAIRLQAPRKDA